MSISRKAIAPRSVKNYIRQHAQEMDESVMQRHIDLYVNHYTLDYGADGEAAIADLFARAEKASIVPQCDQPLFVSHEIAGIAE